MKALKIIGIVLLSLIIIVAIVVISLPSHSHVERSIVIKASPSQVFTELNSFKNFNAWSPWAALDPNTKYEYSGPESGVGAFMSWKSDNGNVGNGTQKIIVSEAPNRIKNEMTFEGFEDKSYAEFVLTPEASETKVTWTYDGDMKGLYKIFGLMMDNMLGPTYEQGLKNLKGLVESKLATQPEAEVVTDTVISSN
jgi:hypothetical protein